MPMSVPAFFAQFKQLKAYLADRSDASPELRKAFADLAAGFKAAYSPEAFKQALAESQQVSSDLEERVTSAMVLMKRERALRPGGDTA